MVFDTWTALRTAIKDALADSLAGTPNVGQFTKGERTLRYRSYEELTGLLEKTYALEALENTGDPSKMKSYGRFRRW